MKNTLILFCLVTNFLIVSGQNNIVKLNGPFGADVVSLYKDTRGVLWIGTGSSGGVYWFDKNKSQWHSCNNGIGPVFVGGIIELNNKIICKANSQFYYLEEDSTWKLINENQEKFVNSELENIKLNRKEKLKELLDLKGNYFDKIKIDVKLVNQILVIDSVIFILDKRGLFYLGLRDKNIKQFTSNGLIASDIYQIIPFKNCLYIWTNSYELWKYDSIWSLEAKLPYYFGDNEVSISTIFVNYDGFLNQNQSDGISGISSIGKHSKIIENGLVSISNKGKICVSVRGHLFVLNSEGNFEEKIYNFIEEEYNKPIKEFIYEAIYDNNDKLVFSVNRNGMQLNEDLIVPAIDDGTKTKYFNSNSYKELPGLSQGNSGVIYCDKRPLSFSVGNEETFDKRFTDCFSIYCSTIELENDSIIFDGIKISDHEFIGHEGNLNFKHYKVNNGNLKMENQKIISIFVDRINNKVFFGTSGSGLFLLKK